MGVASMVIGIVAVAIGFVPFCGAWAVIPAVVGLALGIVDLVLKTKRGGSRGMAIAGVVLNPIAIVTIISYFLAADMQMQQQWPQPIDGFDAGPSPIGPQLSPPGWPGQPDPPAQPMQPMQPMQPIDTDQPQQPDTSAAEPVPVQVRPKPAPTPP
ncbi:MAG: DUF4190 domain-containing protein [Deltaproteobacteria bacterium]|nr:DUF4190 domain-containing protein [Deltaproteobacteria bacterium]